MTAPPARNTLSGTPTNAQFNAGIGALYDYTVGLLGASGTPAAARAALDAVGLTGNETIAGVKTFSSPIAGATNSQVSLTGDQTIAGVKSFSSQVNGKTSGTDSIPAFSAATTGGAYNTMWDRRGAPFHAVSETVGSSYSPALSHQYTHNAGWGGVYSVGVLNHAAQSAGSFVIHHINSAAAEHFEWQFNGSNGDFIAPGAISADSGLRANTIANRVGTGAPNFPNGLTAPSITVGALPTFQCRAWVNFNGAGAVAIRGGGNVSSITDNGVGDYTINFITAMPDGNYAITGTCNTIQQHPVVGVSLHTHDTSFARVLTGTSGSSASTGFVTDPDFVFVAIFR